MKANTTNAPEVSSPLAVSKDKKYVFQASRTRAEERRVKNRASSATKHAAGRHTTKNSSAPFTHRLIGGSSCAGRTPSP
jgi:hypothetical protein